MRGGLSIGPKPEPGSTVLIPVVARSGMRKFWEIPFRGRSDLEQETIAELESARAADGTITLKPGQLGRRPRILTSDGRRRRLSVQSRTSSFRWWRVCA
jgi:hypothetical protein